MSANPPTLLTPVSDRELDGLLAGVASAVVREANRLTVTADYALNVLTNDNLAAGLLVVLEPGAPGQRPMTADEMASYRLYFSQVADIARLWAEGSPPPAGLVLPWLPVGSVVIV